MSPCICKSRSIWEIFGFGTKFAKKALTESPLKQKPPGGFSSYQGGLRLLQVVSAGFKWFQVVPQ